MSYYCRLVPDKDGIVGKGINFNRLRRVTGYLTSDLSRFNDGKRAEVADRVKHMRLTTPA